ncbi:type II toxin-antitoxin system RelE/ParE family toxin [Nostoc sp. UHCC 0302]|uniref:type II toxin-antitoxin system RelE/ParE family toxin n=1 Tax=Nostoc sp. UHCC 0302 TaxID=3134896 RepID=UPI00311C9EBC
MSEVNKRPQVIRDLIELATYIAFLAVAEKTFQQLAKIPGIGKNCQFSHPSLGDIRQYAIKGFKKYIIFYRVTELGIEILRVIHGARDIEAILDEDLRDNN